MLQSYQMQQKVAYQKTLKELAITTFSISTLLAVVIWYVAPFIIGWIDKPVYSTYVNDLTLLIAAGFLYAIGYIPHYALYAIKGDKLIIAEHISAMVVFLFSPILVQLENSIQTVALALFLAFFCMAIIKPVGYTYTRQQSVLLNA